MRVPCGLTIIGLLLPAMAHAQAWRAALDAGDYARAAELLHPIVVESLALSVDDDPAPSRYFPGSTQKGVASSAMACAPAPWPSTHASLRTWRRRSSRSMWPASNA